MDSLPRSRLERCVTSKKRLRGRLVYGLSAKKRRRCREVAVSGGSTVQVFNLVLFRISPSPFSWSCDSCMRKMQLYLISEAQV